MTLTPTPADAPVTSDVLSLARQIFSAVGLGRPEASDLTPIVALLVADRAALCARMEVAERMAEQASNLLEYMDEAGMIPHTSIDLIPLRDAHHAWSKST